jgi:alpha-beta hydrolase superfamily lysophospholipase
LIVHGYGEHCGRYDPVMRFLAERGHAVTAFDARGHGRSGGQRGYVSGFDAYVDDLAVVAERVRALWPGSPLIVLGHSNGGLTAIRAVERKRVDPAGLVVTNPLIALRRRRRPVPDAVASLLSKILPRLPLPSGVRPGDLTHDEALLEALAQDRLVHRVGTPRWYWSATLAGREALARARELSVPLLVVLGDADPLVDPDRALEFFEAAGSSDKRLLTRAGERHEVLNELDRTTLFAEIAVWLEQVAAAASDRSA